MASSSSHVRKPLTPSKKAKLVEIQEVRLPYVIHVQGPLHGIVPFLSFLDYDVQNEHQFFELEFSIYAEVVKYSNSNKWAMNCINLTL
jgi:hypothetical protein